MRTHLQRVASCTSFFPWRTVWPKFSPFGAQSLAQRAKCFHIISAQGTCRALPPTQLALFLYVHSLTLCVYMAADERKSPEMFEMYRERGVRCESDEMSCTTLFLSSPRSVSSSLSLIRRTACSIVTFKSNSTGNSSYLTAKLCGTSGDAFIVGVLPPVACGCMMRCTIAHIICRSTV